jgi:hypothetical protein
MKSFFDLQGDLKLYKQSIFPGFFFFLSFFSCIQYFSLAHQASLPLLQDILSKKIRNFNGGFLDNDVQDRYL